jgi:hypothetical protein
MVAHLEIPRTQWTGKQAALRATEIRWSRGGARGRHASKQSMRSPNAIASSSICLSETTTRLPSELSDRTRSGHYSSKEA